MSEIRATTISDTAGTGPITLTKQSAAKAWINFNGTGTVAIRKSVNHSSLTDHGTGDYSVNFSSAFSDANHASVGSTQGSGIGGVPIVAVNQALLQTTTSVRLYANIGSSATATDLPYIGLVTHGDLA